MSDDDVEYTITIHIKKDGMYYESELPLEEVIFWLGAIINGAYSNLFDNPTEVSDGGD